MAEIKSAGAAADKWGRRTSTAGPEYEEGVRNPRKDWAEQTGKAEKNYEAGVQAAIQRKSFGKGVANTGTSGWQAAALAKGPGRFAQGVSGAIDKYRAGFQPFQETIANLALPARGPKGDPNNINRVSVIASALHKKKIELQGK